MEPTNLSDKLVRTGSARLGVDPEVMQQHACTPFCHAAHTSSWHGVWLELLLSRGSRAQEMSIAAITGCSCSGLLLLVERGKGGQTAVPELSESGDYSQLLPQSAHAELAAQQGSALSGRSVVGQ